MRLPFRLSAPSALALALAACGISPEERRDRAETALAEHRFSAARLDLVALVQEAPGNHEAREMLARTQLELGDGEGAWATLAALAKNNPAPADLAELRAEAALLRGRYEEALILAALRNTANGARIEALAHAGLGNGEAALEAFEKGSEATGNQARLLADFALFVLKAGDTARAEALAQEALAAQPVGLDPLLATARIAMAQGRLQEALTHYETAAAHWPESRAARIGQIGLLGDLGRIAEMSLLIAELTRQAPDDPEVIYLRARLAAENRDWREVRALLQEIEGRDDPRQQLLYARSLVELGLTEQALPRLQTLVRRAPQAGAPRRLLAQAQMTSGDANAAYTTIRPLAFSPDGTAQDLALFAAAAKSSGRDSAIGDALTAAPPAERLAQLLAAGDASLREENWRGAIDAYAQLRAWTGDSNAIVLNNLAYARSKAGQVDEALALSEKALRLAPAHPSVMDTAGWLLVQSGSDRERGIALLQRAAELAPDNAAIAAHLAAARRQ